MKPAHIWWFGFSTVILGIALLMVSHSIYVRSKVDQLTPSDIVTVLDVAGTLGVIGGAGTMLVSAWISVSRSRSNSRHTLPDEPF